MRHLKLAIAAMLLPLAGHAAQELTFEAVWHSGSASNFVTGPQSRAEFIATGETLTQQGLRLVDVESALVNRERVYSGVWVTGTGTNLFIGPMGAIDMREEREARLQQNLRLADFEIFRTPEGGRRYLGVWAPGTGEEVLTGPMQEEAFLARGQTLVEDRDLRLIDVEVERVSGVLLYHGLFRSGVGGNFLTTPRRRGNFIELRDQMVADGFELVDFERIGSGVSARYVGVWSTGDGESSLSVPRDFAAFVAFGEDLTANGFRTRDMELAVIGRPDPQPPADPRPDPDPGSGEPPTTADLPTDPPPGIELVSGNILRVDFTLDDAGEVAVELPRAHLADWLPSHEGEVILPDAFCGFNIARAGRFFWQVPGDDAVDDFPFNSVEDVSGELGPDFFLGGIEFTGPIGACAGTQTEWQLDFPFTQGGAAFEPLPNMRLVIQLDPDGEIRFREHGAPEGEMMDVGELFSDDVFEQLEAIMEAFAETGEDNGYCEGVQGYMVEVCDQNPGLCPVNPDEGPPVC